MKVKVFIQEGEELVLIGEALIEAVRKVFSGHGDDIPADNAALTELDALYDRRITRARQDAAIPPAPVEGSDVGQGLGHAPTRPATHPDE